MYMWMETGFQLRYKKRDKLSTYSLIFWSTSHGECQVTRSRFRNPEENHSVSMPFSTPFISWKGEEKVSAFQAHLCCIVTSTVN